MITFTKQELFIIICYSAMIPMSLLACVEDYMGKDAWIKWISENWWDTNFMIWLVLLIISIYVIRKFINIGKDRGLSIEYVLKEKKSNG